MKNILKISVLILLFIILHGTGARLLGQPEPPGVPINHGSKGNISNNNAPAGNGLGIFLLLGMAYGMKIYRNRRVREAENDHP